MTIVALRGWMLDAAAEIDLALPGFAGAILRSGPERRHVIAAYLACAPASPLSHIGSLTRAAIKEAGDFLLQSASREIIVATFGSCPIGMTGAVSRSGHQPFSDAYYRRLHRVLGSGREKYAQARRCVMHLSTLSEERLDIICRLPEVLRLPTVVETLSAAVDAADITSMWRKLRNAGLSEKDLLHSLRQASRHGTIADCIVGWAAHIPFPACPIPQQDRFAPISNGRDVRSLGLRFRNCVSEMMPLLLDGQRSLGTYRCEDGTEIVVELEATGSGTIWRSLNGYRNRPVAAVHREEVCRFLRSYGVRARFSPPPSPFAVLRRVSGSAKRWPLW